MTVRISPDITGRDDELEELFGHLAEAMKGHGRLVLVSGEAGIGKTRLVEEFESFAERVGCKTILGRCIPGASGPYLPFIEAFKVSLGIEFFSDTTDQTGTHDNELPLFSTIDNIKGLAVDKTLVFHLEDFQWADPASIQMLHFLARNSEAVRVLYIVTYRPEDLLGDSSRLIHPFLESMRIMKREGICNEICLERLEDEDIREMIEGLLGGKVDSGLLDVVAGESCGNPLFAVETVRMLATTGLIEEKNGEWKLSEKEHFEVPSTITQVILNRIERMSRKERNILEVASVIGERFDPFLLQNALDINMLELFEILDHLEKDLQLVQADEDCYRFSNKKIQRVLYEQMPYHRRKELYRLVGLDMEHSEGMEDPTQRERHDKN